MPNSRARNLECRKTLISNIRVPSRGALTRLRLGSSLASVTSKQLKIDANPPMSLRLQLHATPCSCAGGRSRPRRRVRPRLEQRACPCGGRDGQLPSRPPTQRAQGPNWDAPASSSGPLRRQSTRQVRSVWVCRSIGRSIGRVWCLVGICIWCTRGWLPSRGFDPPAGCCPRRQDFFGVSSLLRISRSVCGGVGKENYPGLVAFAGVRSPRRVSWNRRCWVWLGGVVV